MPIQSVYIENYKSIRDSGKIEIRPINILIGPNGAGKSNFVSFFKLIHRIYERRLQSFVAENGYADKMLYFGRKRSPYLSGGIHFWHETNPQLPGGVYYFNLISDQESTFFLEETSSFEEGLLYWDSAMNKSRESRLQEQTVSEKYKYVGEYFDSFKVFHFHDTTANSPLKQPPNSHDYAYLREDGSNLAAYLYRIKNTHPNHFTMIEYTVRSVAPFFDRFDLQPDAINADVIFLKWLEQGSDEYFNAHNLSDGTLRFIALTTLLLQPDLPKTIIIDEPELGLHPFAIQKLAAMIKSASTKSQVIVSTQSVNLLDQFEADDVIVVEREDNQTVFKRQNTESLSQWLQDYSLGELWDKNVLGGTP